MEGGAGRAAPPISRDRQRGVSAGRSA